MIRSSDLEKNLNFSNAGRSKRVAKSVDLDSFGLMKLQRWQQTHIGIKQVRLELCSVSTVMARELGQQT